MKTLRRDTVPKTAPPGGPAEVEQLRARAEQGDADAQFNLGCVYDNGEGVAQDVREAARWFRLAADQGHTDAQYLLGAKYDYGRGVGQDDREAVRLYRLAADQGCESAQRTLGGMYRDGRGVAQDDREAAHWRDLADSNRAREREGGENEKGAPPAVAREIAAGVDHPKLVDMPQYNPPFSPASPWVLGIGWFIVLGFILQLAAAEFFVVWTISLGVFLVVRRFHRFTQLDDLVKRFCPRPESASEEDLVRLALGSRMVFG